MFKMNTSKQLTYTNSGLGVMHPREPVMQRTEEEEQHSSTAIVREVIIV